MGLGQRHWAPATGGGQRPRTARPWPSLTAGWGALEGFPGPPCAVISGGWDPPAPSHRLSYELRHWAWDMLGVKSRAPGQSPYPRCQLPCLPPLPSF